MGVAQGDASLQDLGCPQTPRPWNPHLDKQPPPGIFTMVGEFISHIPCPKHFLCLASSMLVFFWYYRMSVREFGGITGDLAGYFLQICELALLGASVLGVWIW